MDSSSFDEIFRRFQSVTGTSTQQELADVLGINRPFPNPKSAAQCLQAGFWFCLKCAG